MATCIGKQIPAHMSTMNLKFLELRVDRDVLIEGRGQQYIIQIYPITHSPLAWMGKTEVVFKWKALEKSDLWAHICINIDVYPVWYFNKPYAFKTIVTDLRGSLLNQIMVQLVQDFVFWQQPANCGKFRSRKVIHLIYCRHQALKGLLSLYPQIPFIW